MSLPELTPSLLEIVLGEENPSVYPPCPDCGGESGPRTTQRGFQEYICKSKSCCRNFRDSTKNQPRKKLNNPTCPDCSSERTHKRGTDKKTGDKKYRCYDCLRNFRKSNISENHDLFKEQQINSETEADTNSRTPRNSIKIPDCPDCGSKSYLRSKKRRQYQCLNVICKRRFGESTKNLKRNETGKVNRKKGYPPCPDCNGTWIRKRGICRTTNTQKYFCNDCEYLYTELTKNQPRPVYPPCPECNSKDVKKQGVSHGRQKYRCKSCKTFFYEYRDDPPCPDCHSKNIKKGGLKKGQQRYECKDCHRHFSESTKDKPKNSPNIFDYDSDFWDLRAMGIKFPPSANWFTANFEEIKHSWLKQTAKAYIKYDLSINSPATSLSNTNWF
jgi:transposase-like protein